MSLVDDLRKWEPLELAKTLAQHAHENAALRNRVHELEHELFWMRAAENEAARRTGAREAEPACQRCKHWDRADDYETGHSLGLGRCGNIPMFWDATDWSDNCDGRVIKPEFKNVKAFAQDGSDYWAKVLTQPDFSCSGFAAAAPEEKGAAE